MRTSRRFCIVMALIVSFAFVGFVTFAKAEVDSKLKGEIKTSMDKGIKWLMEHQESDGSYEHNAGITALAATAFMRSPQHYTESNSPNVKNAIKYIVSKANTDGSIFDTGPASYTTAVAIMALVETKNPAYKDIIKKAQGYIVDMQLDDGEKVDPSNPLYGGFGYSKSDDRGLRGDMSNIHFSLEALKASGLPQDSAVWDKAIKFIERCQNRSESNDQKWAGDDGGFIYTPTPRSPAGETKSYASMTYSGIESFIYANVDKKDPRVQDAVKWIQSNYSLDENTPIGANGL
ncbi:MAG: hypothetical protein QG588_2394, partial [Candidatus Poribacteria bacterium]|nr:hypothetical protein [Candidatus Poribacteria bacterium]